MSVFTDYQRWLFDGDLKSELSNEILSAYVISNQYLISTFLSHGRLNQYLNEYFNNSNLFYINKKELLMFIKKCVINFKVKKGTLTYIPFSKKNKTIDSLCSKFPGLKNGEIILMYDLLKDNKDKDSIYVALGLESDNKSTLLKEIRKENKEIRSIDNYIKKNFKIKKI